MPSNLLMLYINFFLWHEIWFDRNMIATNVFYTDLRDMCFHSFRDDFLVLFQNKKKCYYRTRQLTMTYLSQEYRNCFLICYGFRQKSGMRSRLHRWTRLQCWNPFYWNWFGFIRSLQLSPCKRYTISINHERTLTITHWFPEHVCVDVSECDAVRSYVIMYRKWCRKGTNKLDRIKNSTPLI